MVKDRSDVQETLVHLYLRLNGYFVSGFIAHGTKGVKTEIDVLAIRFPKHKESEREVNYSEHLSIPADKIDFLIGEVKGGKNVGFNTNFRNDQAAIQKTLQRFGAFDPDEITRAINEIPNLLDQRSISRKQSFPSIELKCSTCLSSQPINLRFALFAAEKTRESNNSKYWIMQDDMINFIWKCFRPDKKREKCDDRYNFELWGPQFTKMVQVFKDKGRDKPPVLEDIYAIYDRSNS